MKILYISQYFPPEMGAPAARAAELARHWASAGHEVSILTGFPNHPTGVVPEEWRPRLRRLLFHEQIALKDTQPGSVVVGVPEARSPKPEAGQQEPGTFTPPTPSPAS